MVWTFVIAHPWACSNNWCWLVAIFGNRTVQCLIHHATIVSFRIATIRANTFANLSSEFKQRKKWKIFEEHCVCVKLWFKLSKFFTETFKMVQQTFSEDWMSRMQCYKCSVILKGTEHQPLKDTRPGWPSMSTNNHNIDGIYPSYSPYLVPTDYFLFPKLNVTMKGCWF